MRIASRYFVVCGVAWLVGISRADAVNVCRMLGDVAIGESVATLVRVNRDFEYSGTEVHDDEIEAIRPDKRGIETTVRARNDRIVEIMLRPSRRDGVIAFDYEKGCGTRRWSVVWPSVPSGKKSCYQIDAYLERVSYSNIRGVTQVVLLDTRYATERINASEEIIRKRSACSK